MLDFPDGGLDVDACRKAVDCYVTFRETMEHSGIKSLLPDDVAFEFFGERFTPPVGDLFFGLETGPGPVGIHRS